MKRILLQLTLLMSVIFAVYWPTIGGELISGDDTDLFARLDRVDSWNLNGLFFRTGSQLLYYRPLTILSYHFDKLVLDLDTSLMHIENILFHGFCATMVYFLTRYLLSPERRTLSYLPLLAAILFGVHPLTTESTTWISGRTDIMAAMFILPSAVLILRFRERHNWLLLVVALFSFALAAFGKEVAVAFMPGALALLFARPVVEKVPALFARKKSRAGGIWLVFWVVASFSVFFAMRFVAHGSSGNVGLTLRIIFNDLWYSTFVCLRGIGFYFKKLFFPWPLNFAILEIDPVYELLGIPVVLLVLYLMARRTLPGAFVVAGAFLVTPSFLLMFNQIAWTPYAERYLYVPLAFLIPSLVVWLGQQRDPWVLRAVRLLALVTIMSFALTTFDRSRVWSTNLGIWGDTVVKSPLSLSAKNDYGLALYNNGILEEALPYFKAAAETYSGVNYNPKYGVNYGIALMETVRLGEAESALTTVLERRKGKYGPAREAMTELYDLRIAESLSDSDKIHLAQELQALLDSFDEDGPNDKSE